MDPVVLSFLIGVASSAVVSYFIYRKQAKDGLESELKVLMKVSSVLRIANVAAATGYEAVDNTKRIARDVQLLRRQITQALSTGETAKPAHLAAARDILGYSECSLSVGHLLRLHKTLLAEDFEYAGQLRDAPTKIVGVDLGGQRQDLETPNPSLLPGLLAELLEGWSARQGELKGQDNDFIANELALLHVRLLRIHPFFDGNGLVARLILAVYSEHYLGKSILMSRGDPAYLSALAHASDSDASMLATHILSELENVVGPAADPSSGTGETKSIDSPNE